MAHDHVQRANRTRLAIAFGITISVLAVEVIGALISGSLALLADAGHVTSDSIGLLVALIASAVALRPATDRHTFGFQRLEVLAALVNGLLLAVVAVWVADRGDPAAARSGGGGGRRVADDHRGRGRVGRELRGVPRVAGRRPEIPQPARRLPRRAGRHARVDRRPGRGGHHPADRLRTRRRDRIARDRRADRAARRAPAARRRPGADRIGAARHERGEDPRAPARDPGGRRGSRRARLGDHLRRARVHGARRGRIERVRARRDRAHARPARRRV